ncbi:hypothetical protein PR048_022838 [Dryococelus australis]|uniref:Kinesin-like protein n=1 Tax=Dryococelus australis TaxID=614101 RepID=A0ABQ9GSG1_9NEOP|nr:hypothetical protein PR048_022838 [Dryococelus australis]
MSHVGKEDEDVRVIVRCRPLTRSEADRNCRSVVQVMEDQGLIEIRNSTTNAERQVFKFDTVYGCYSNQEDIYEKSVRPVVSSVLEGFNGTIFAYGQTGSGKTYTMEGDISDKGVVPRSFEHMFDCITSSCNTRYLVQASFLEIYQDEIKDLLDPHNGNQLVVREKPKIGVEVYGISSCLCNSKEDLERVLAAGIFSRSTGATKINERSSRSHAILTVTVEMDNGSPQSGQVIRVGKLNLVDLAGSERQSKSGAVGKRLREAARINLSLSALGNVISALVEGRQHVPYRDSKLTHLLKDSLGGNAKTLMIANIGPASYNYFESLNTLQYASRAKNIQNKPVVNSEPKDALVRVYQQEIERLNKLLSEQNPQMVMKIPVQVRSVGEQTDLYPDSHDNELRRKGSISSQVYLEIKESAVNEIERNKELVAVEKKEVEELKEKIALMESTLLHGSKSIMDLTNEQQMALEVGRKKIVRQKDREISIRQQVRLRQEMWQTYSTLQQKVDAKAHELQALRFNVDVIKGENLRVTSEMDTLIRELNDEQNTLLKELKKKFLIMEKFIRIDELNALIGRASYDESRQCWFLQPSQCDEPQMRNRYSEIISRYDSHSGNGRRFCRDIIELELDHHPRTTYDLPLRLHNNK